MSASRNDRFKERKSRFREPRVLHVIAMEGKETEYAYFDELRTYVKATITVDLIKNYSNKSAPGKVLQLLKKHLKEKKPDSKDRSWIVIDHDGQDDGILDEVCANAAKMRNCTVVLSNPCFEIWLHFHLRNLPLPVFHNQRDCHDRLSEIFPGFTKSSYNVQNFLDPTLGKLSQAVCNAESTDIPGHTVEAWPRAQTSRLHLMVRELVDVPLTPQQTAALERKQQAMAKSEERARAAKRKADADSSTA